MSKGKDYTKPIGAKAYAAMAEVEGLRLSKEGRKRLVDSKDLSPEKRRAVILRAHAAKAPSK